MRQLAGYDVSRETFERLTVYAGLLEKWNPKINIVSQSTIANLWTRHFADSAQLMSLVPATAENWIDLGSGGGFPGLVIAILGMEKPDARRVTLVECDARKAAFLRTVIRETDAPARVLTQRIEQLDPQSADILSARALAPLTDLLEYASLHLNADGLALFPKGENWEKELSTARQRWNFECEAIKSRTHPDAVVLRISGVSRV